MLLDDSNSLDCLNLIHRPPPSALRTGDFFPLHRILPIRRHLFYLHSSFYCPKRSSKKYVKAVGPMQPRLTRGIFFQKCKTRRSATRPPHTKLETFYIAYPSVSSWLYKELWWVLNRNSSQSFVVLPSAPPVPRNSGTWETSLSDAFILPRIFYLFRTAYLSVQFSPVLK